MKKFLRYFIVMTAYCCYLQPVQGQTAWNKIYDFCDDTIAANDNVAQYADDGFFIAAGHTHTPGISTYHCYLASFDYSGKVLQKRYLYFPGKYNMMPSSYFDYITQPLIKFSDNKYLLLGVEYDNVSNSKTEVYQPFFYFFNKNLDSLHFRKYTDSNISRLPHSAAKDQDNNFVITGIISSKNVHYSNGAYYWDTGYVWLAKFDSSANMLWSKKLFANTNPGNWGSNPVSGIEEPYKVIAGHNGDAYFIAGKRWNPANGWFDVFLTKTDFWGNIVWNKFIPRPNLSWGDMDIISLTNGNYAFISTTQDQIGSNQPTHFFYGSFDGDGNIIWSKTFSKIKRQNRGVQIAETDNGDLLLFGLGFPGMYRSTLVRTLNNGDIKWYREYVHIDTTLYYQRIHAMSYTPTKQVLLSGVFDAVAVPGVFDSTGKWSWFVLTDTFGCLKPGCQAEDTMWHTGITAAVNNSDIEVSVYPNPAREMLYIQTGATSHRLQAYLTDMNGRRICIKQLSGNNKHALDIRELPPGLYMLEIWEDGRRVKVYKVEHY